MSNNVLPVPQATQTIEPTSLFSNYLMEVARSIALLDAGVQTVALSCIDQLVHFLFNYIFFIFYPAYDTFYYEMQVEAFKTAGKELPVYESCGFREAVLFIHRFICSPSCIGSIFPSSSGLVEAITRKVADAAKNPAPQRYLEIGAGTGSFTQEIINQMKPSDHLDVVEYDADLCRHLQRRFHHLKNVTIHQISILDYDAPKYDLVVSGLPLTNFTPEFVQEAHQKYVDLTKTGGFFSYFEYIGGSTIKQAFLCCEAAEKFAQVVALKNALVQSYGEEVDNVWWNITPARAIHCQVNSFAGAHPATLGDQQYTGTDIHPACVSNSHLCHKI